MGYARRQELFHHSHDTSLPAVDDNWVKVYDFRLRNEGCDEHEAEYDRDCENDFHPVFAYEAIQVLHLSCTEGTGSVAMGAQLSG